jgi:iron complex transport system ATP-binding protein
MNLCCDDISFFYPTEKNAALKNISFDIKAGEHIALIGPNGSGKSTLFNIIAGFLRASGGRALLDGRDIASLSVRERSRRIAFVPQGGRINFPYTCLETVLMALYACENRFSATSGENLFRAEQMMRKTGIWDFAGKSVRAISGGQLQKVILTRALLQLLPDIDSPSFGNPNDGGILLLDEALSELDIAARIAMMKLLCSFIASHNITVIGIHHDLSHVPRFTSRVIAISDGALAADGTPDEVFTKEFFRRVFSVHADIVEGKGFVFYDNL